MAIFQWILVKWPQNKRANQIRKGESKVRFLNTSVLIFLFIFSFNLYANPDIKMDKKGNYIFYRWGWAKYHKEMIKGRVFSKKSLNYFLGQVHHYHGGGLYLASNPYCSSGFAGKGAEGTDSEPHLMEVHVPTSINLIQCTLDPNWYLIRENKGVFFSRFSGEGLSDEEIIEIQNKFDVDNRVYKVLEKEGDRVLSQRNKKRKRISDSSSEDQGLCKK